MLHLLTLAAPPYQVPLVEGGASLAVTEQNKHTWLQARLRPPPSSFSTTTTTSSSSSFVATCTTSASATPLRLHPSAPQPPHHLLQALLRAELLDSCAAAATHFRQGLLDVIGVSPNLDAADANTARWLTPHLFLLSAEELRSLWSGAVRPPMGRPPRGQWHLASACSLDSCSPGTSSSCSTSTTNTPGHSHQPHLLLTRAHRGPLCVGTARQPRVRRRAEPRRERARRRGDAGGAIWSQAPSSLCGGHFEDTAPPAFLDRLKAPADDSVHALFPTRRGGCGR